MVPKVGSVISLEFPLDPGATAPVSGDVGRLESEEGLVLFLRYLRVIDLGDNRINVKARIIPKIDLPN
jgi:hypothetical protein